MVETKEKEVIYTQDPEAGPSTLVVTLFALMIVAVLGFMVYYMSANNITGNIPTIIERESTTNTTTPVPVPVPGPTSAPNINVMPGNNPPPSEPAPISP